MDTTFVPGTPVVSTWLNDVNTVVYNSQDGVVGTVSRTQLQKNAEVVSVMDFGATGDGTTDDTAAIQAAINYVENTYDPAVYGSNSPADGTCTLFFPAGYYKVTDTLQLTKKVAVKGDGPGEFSSGSRVVQFTSNKDLFKLTPINQGASISFEDMSLISNTSGSGHLIHIVRGAGGGTSNSQRYLNLVLGTPQSQGIAIEAGDDIIIDKCLFDVSASGCISLGTTTAADTVSNIRIINCAFFEVDVRCILITNATGIIINNPQVYSGGAGRTQFFVDGYTIVPTQIRNLTINGGTFGLFSSTGSGNTSGVDCLIKATAVAGLNIVGTSAVNAGLSGASTESFVALTGACTNVVINSNQWSGHLGTQNFYNDAGGTVTRASVSSNQFVATGGSGTCIQATNTSSAWYGDNLYSNFTRNITTSNYYTSGVFVDGPQTLTYSASVSADVSLGGSLTLVVTNTSAFTINAPTGTSTGQTVSYTIKNASGGVMGAITWNTVFKMSAWTNPANNFNRTITFKFDGANWFEVNKTTVDVSN